MVQLLTMIDVFRIWLCSISADELTDQEGDRPPDAGDGGNGHDGTEADFSGGGLSGFSSLGDSFFGGGGVGVHGVSPMLLFPQVF